MKKVKIILVLAAVLLVAAGGFWLFRLVGDASAKNDEIKELEKQIEEMQRKQIAVDTIKEEIKQIS